MNIRIYDDNDNWLKWGTLVQDWIEAHTPPPLTVGELRTQMLERGIAASVAGMDNTPVRILHGSREPGLTIALPSAAQLHEQLDLFANPGSYPLPIFYDVPFGGAPRVMLSLQEAYNLTLRRVGEFAATMVVHSDYEPPAE